jgi:hypothetical protein
MTFIAVSVAAGGAPRRWRRHAPGPMESTSARMASGNAPSQLFILPVKVNPFSKNCRKFYRIAF